MKNSWIYFLFFILATPGFAQNSDTLSVKKQRELVVKDTTFQKQEVNPLAPSKAAFYSAVLPGLGQAYNKRYWKIPIIYAGMATGVYFYIQNNKDYNRFRDAYKSRLAGYTNDEFWGDGTEPIISSDRLIDAQKNAKRNKDLSIVVSIAFYLLNIVDANVDAHLKQFNVNDDLSVQPNVNFNTLTSKPNYGVKFSFNLH